MMARIGRDDVEIMPHAGYTDILAFPPEECACCHRMTSFFRNEGGMTRCTGCEGKTEARP